MLLLNVHVSKSGERRGWIGSRNEHKFTERRKDEMGLETHDLCVPHPSHIIDTNLSGVRYEIMGARCTSNEQRTECTASKELSRL